MPGVHPNAVVVLEASLDGDYTMVRYPFDLDSGPAVAPAVARPRWGVAERLSYTAARLPGCMARLLDGWRQMSDGDLPATVARVEAAGYRLYWAARS